MYGDDDDEDQDELSMTPAQFDTTQDPMYQLDKGRAKAATRLKSTFEDIFEKYGKDFDGDDDVINFYTDEIEVDNGHVQSLEYRKGSPEGSPSDEEDRIMRGKSSAKNKKSRSKSVIPSTYIKCSRGSHPPWNEPPGFNAPGLSNFAFSSSFGSAPFDLGRFTFGNTHVDPVWQAPDLPFQLQQRPSFGIGQGQFGSFGGLSSYASKRLVSAKSFLRAGSAQSKPTSIAVEDEEDNIILGKSRHPKPALSGSEDRKTVDTPATTTSGSLSFSSSSSQLPSFSGIGIDDDELQLEPDDITVRDKNKPEAPLATKVPLRLTSQQSANSGGTASHYQSSSSSPSRLSPTRRKRRRPKKSDTEESFQVSNKGSDSDLRTLQPNERRIEIVIPIMKRLLQSTTEQPTEQPASLVDKRSQHPDEEPSVTGDQSIDITPLQDSLQSSRSADDPRDAAQWSSEDVIEEIQGVVEKDTHRSSEGREIQQGHSKQTQALVELLDAETLPQNREILEGISQEMSSLQKVADSHTNDAMIGLNSNHDREGYNITAEQQLCEIIGVDADQDLAAPDTHADKSREDMQVVEHDQEVLVHLIPPTGVLDGDDSIESTEVIDSSLIEAAALETAELQEQSPRSENEEVTRQLSECLISVSNDEEILSTSSVTLDNTVSPLSDVGVDGVHGVSEAVRSWENQISASEEEALPQSPEHSGTPDLTESGQHSGRDYVSVDPYASGIQDGEEFNPVDQSPSHNDLVAEIDTLQLESDDAEVERSFSPEIVELPDQDLSVFPNGESTPDIALPLSSSSIDNDDQDSIKIGRSPSPELGTPIRSKTSHDIIPQTETSPTPTTPTRKHGSKGGNHTSTFRRTPSSKRFPLTSLLPEGIDDESDDELSIAGSITSTGSRLFSPFFRPPKNDNYDLPPLLSTPRNKNKKHNLYIGTPSSSSARPPATDSRTGRSQTRTGRRSAQNRSVHSSPLKRRVAERLLNSSPIKRRGHHGTAAIRSSSVVPSPNSSTPRRCGEDGFECGRDFCFTCCI